MNIQEIASKIKPLPRATGFVRASLQKVLLNETAFLAALLLVVAASSFGLGRYSVFERASISTQSASVVAITENTRENVAPLEGIDQKAAKEANPITDGSVRGQYVGSKNSNKYHLPWCSGAKTISEQNKVWFATKADAESKGYIPASNCKGI